MKEKRATQKKNLKNLNEFINQGVRESGESLYVILMYFRVLGE